MEDTDYKKLSAKESRKMIKGYNGKLNSQIEEEYAIEVYELDNNKTLMDFGSHGFIFNSSLDARSYLENIRKKVKTGRVKHILRGKFDYDNTFPSSTMSLEKELMKLLNVDKSHYSEVEFRDLETSLNKELARGLNPDSVFSNLVAYIGEYMRHSLGSANWKVVKSEHDNVWEPYVVDKEGNIYNPFYIVYKELYEYYPTEGKVSLLDHTKVELIQYRIPIR